MVDVVDAETRRRMMAGIRGKHTKPELVIRKGLHHLGFRFRLHVKDLPGRPDLVLPRFKAAIFVHGCFWHGHDCPLFKIPATRTEFWLGKIARNKTNDAKATNALLEAGWRVGFIWECAIRGADRDIPAVINGVAEWLSRSDTVLEIRA